MLDYPELLNEVIQGFTRLPGIGERSAIRLALHLVGENNKKRIQLSNALRELQALEVCPLCGLFKEDSTCLQCATDGAFLRESERALCVVETFADGIAIHQSQAFTGKYHILGGVLNPLQGIGPKELRLANLMERIDRLAVTRVLLSLSASLEGDATCSYIQENIQKQGGQIVIERVAQGIPTGGSLQYLDGQTIKRAILNRQRLA